MLVISACGSDDDDNGGITGIPEIDAESYDWEILIIRVNEMPILRGSYLIYADWLGDYAAISSEDDISIQFGDQNYDLTGYDYDGSWVFSTYLELNAGQEYNVILRKNGSSVSTANVKIPFYADVDFPYHIDPSQATRLDWYMDGDNEYQVLSLFSFGEDWDQEDDWERLIPSSSRSYIIPANTVSDYGPDTEYELMLVQMNFEKSGRVAYLSSSIAKMTYFDDLPAAKDAQELSKYVKEMRKYFR